MALREQADYRKKLTGQLPAAELRVVYTKSGMYLAAAVVKGPAIIDHELYWGTASTLAEARYLMAILNSDAVTQRVRPLQGRGEHNPRHYDKYIWQLPIPIFDPATSRHVRLADLGQQAEAIVAAIILPAAKRFETMRQHVREVVAETEVGKAIESEVASLLS